MNFSSMPKTTRKHPFKTSALIRERDELLSSWLNPRSPNTKVLDGLSPTFKQLAYWLSKHFGITPELSEGAVRRYVKELRSDDTSLETRKPGRCKTVESQLVTAPPKRHLGRPMEADNCIKAFDATFLAQLTAEAVQLTGLSPNAFYQTFSKQDTWRKFLGVRSGFFYRLQKKLDAKHLASDTSSRRPDDDVEHSLRLYQLTLRTAEEHWCAVLFAYEPRTHFLNAACYVAHPVTTDKQARRLSGRPVKLLDTTWRPTLTTNNGQTTVQLSAKALLEFAEKTSTLMAIPVGNIFLSSSLGNQEELISQLYALDPLAPFSTIPIQHQPFVLPNAGETIRVRSLCRKLEKLLNQHYEEISFAKLKKYQSDLDKAIEEFFNIKRLPSGLHDYTPLKTASAVTDEPAEDRRQIAKKYATAREDAKERFHVKRHLHIAPIHLACDDN